MLRTMTRQILFLVILALAAAGFKSISLHTSGESVEADLIGTSGNEALFAAIALDGQLVNQSHRSSVSQILTWQPGSLSVQAARLLPGQASFLAARSQTWSANQTLADASYSLNAVVDTRSNQTWMTIRRYRPGQGGSRIAFIPAPLRFTAARSATSGRTWSPSYVMTGQPFAPLTLADGTLYGILPADGECTGSSLLFRVDQWEQDQGYLPADPDFANPAHITILAELPLADGFSLNQLISHGQTLILVSSRPKPDPDAGSQTSSSPDLDDQPNQGLLRISRYSLTGELLDEVIHTADFTSLISISLDGQTLMVQTGGGRAMAHVFAAQGSCVTLGQH